VKVEICEHVLRASATSSPLKRMLVSGYYDGPKNGFAECETCGQTYSFRMLAWDSMEDVRIFGLAPITPSLDEIRTRLLQWPSSSAAFTLIPPLAAEQAAAIAPLEAMPISFVVAALDLGRGLLAKRPHDPVTPDDRDWFAWLGI